MLPANGVQVADSSTDKANRPDRRGHKLSPLPSKIEDTALRLRDILYDIPGLYAHIYGVAYARPRYGEQGPNGKGGHSDPSGGALVNSKALREKLEDAGEELDRAFRSAQSAQVALHYAEEMLDEQRPLTPRDERQRERPAQDKELLEVLVHRRLKLDGEITRLTKRVEDEEKRERARGPHTPKPPKPTPEELAEIAAEERQLRAAHAMSRGVSA